MKTLIRKRQIAGHLEVIHRFHALSAKRNRLALTAVGIAMLTLVGCEKNEASSTQEKLGPLDLAGQYNEAASPQEKPGLLDLAGQYVDPLARTDARITVFLFTRFDCPISNRYAPEVRRLHEKFAAEKVKFWLVYPDPDQTADVIRKHLKEYDYPFGALRDPYHVLVKMIEATITPEAAVFVHEDSGSRLVYRGRIDDGFPEFGVAREARKHDLEDALEATLKGEPVVSATTKAVGCFITDLEPKQPGPP